MSQQSNKDNARLQDKYEYLISYIKDSLAKKGIEFQMLRHSQGDEGSVDSTYVAFKEGVTIENLSSVDTYFQMDAVNPSTPMGLWSIQIQYFLNGGSQKKTVTVSFANILTLLKVVIQRMDFVREKLHPLKDESNVDHLL